MFETVIEHVYLISNKNNNKKITTPPKKKSNFFFYSNNGIEKKLSLSVVSIKIKKKTIQKPTQHNSLLRHSYVSYLDKGIILHTVIYLISPSNDSLLQIQSHMNAQHLKTLMDLLICFLHIGHLLLIPVRLDAHFTQAIRCPHEQIRFLQFSHPPCIICISLERK